MYSLFCPQGNVLKTFLQNEPFQKNIPCNKQGTYEETKSKANGLLHKPKSLRFETPLLEINLYKRSLGCLSEETLKSSFFFFF